MLSDETAGVCPRCEERTLKRVARWQWRCDRPVPNRRHKTGYRPCGFVAGLVWLFLDPERVESGRRPQHFSPAVQGLIELKIWDAEEPLRLLTLPFSSLVPVLEAMVA